MDAIGLYYLADIMMQLTPMNLPLTVIQSLVSGVEIGGAEAAEEAATVVNNFVFFG